MRTAAEYRVVKEDGVGGDDEEVKQRRFSHVYRSVSTRPRVSPRGENAERFRGLGRPGMMSLVQKSLLGLTILAVVAVVTFLRSGRRFGLEARRKDGLLLEMIANISGGLDKLDAEFGGMSARTELARNRLRQLVALHRENLALCANLVQEKKRRLTSRRKESAVEGKT